MDFWKNNTIWFDELPKEFFIDIDYKEIKNNMNTVKDKKYIILWNYKCNKDNDFMDLPENNSIEYLRLNRSNNKSFKGIEKISGIKRLELNYCIKLENDIGLSALQNTIEWLCIDQSSKFKISSELFTLKNLKVLCLNNCGEIDSLDFLEYFPNLVDFRFVNTNILDGNLTPIIKHPTLISAGFLYKRHYTHKPEELNSLIFDKNKIKEKIIYKGDFKTFRYSIFD
jgi:hypothetical protein